MKVLIKGSEKQLLATQSNANGQFALRWKPSTPGSFEVRAHVAGNEIAAGAASVSRSVTAYRPALASWYGPGLYGNRTGCGQTLTPGILGVAHKSIPCGTKITFRYRGRTVRAPVIDRGPYVGSREFDLTEELKERLGFGSTGIVYVSR